MSNHQFEVLATIVFGLAMVHTFTVARFRVWAEHFPEGSAPRNFLDLLGEVEVVFGVWAGGLLMVMWFAMGQGRVIEYLDGLDFTEPAFVFVIMTIASTKPVRQAASLLMSSLARLLPLPREVAYFFTTLVVGPLLGSFITEPAAMTVTALVLRDRYYQRGISTRLMYLTIGLLFVNVSVGGVMTPFAAPPVLMVAGKWGWGLKFMFTHFGWKAITAIVLNSFIISVVASRELLKISETKSVPRLTRSPVWVMAVHLAFLTLVIINAHHLVVFMGLMLFFLGVTAVLKVHNEELRLRESLLVGFFLAGLVVLGGFQRWWLEPLLASMEASTLYLVAAALTAVTDNAALTYLGSQVTALTELSRYALVAGAVVGGGLTVIANAPNPAGYGILNPSFGHKGISPLGLLAGAALPTVTTVILFWVLPNL